MNVDIIYERNGLFSTYDKTVIEMIVFNCMCGETVEQIVASDIFFAFQKTYYPNYFLLLVVDNGKEIDHFQLYMWRNCEQLLAAY